MNIIKKIIWVVIGSVIAAFGIDLATASVRQTEMYVEGFKAKLKKDTSYKGLWIVSFILKEL